MFLIDLMSAYLSPFFCLLFLNDNLLLKRVYRHIIKKTSPYSNFGPIFFNQNLIGHKKQSLPLEPPRNKTVQNAVKEEPLAGIVPWIGLRRPRKTRHKRNKCQNFKKCKFCPSVGYNSCH